MQILRESIKATRSPIPLGHIDNYQDDYDKGTESPNPGVNKTPIAGVAAAPLQPTTPPGDPGRAAYPKPMPIRTSIQRLQRCQLREIP